MPPEQTGAADRLAAAASKHSIAFAQWQAAADCADAAEQALRIALRSNLFVADPKAFEQLAINARALSAIAEKKLDAAVAALTEQA